MTELQHHFSLWPEAGKAQSAESDSPLRSGAVPVHAGGAWQPMRDLTNPFWIKLKGFLFLAVGILASLLLLLDDMKLRNALLLALAIWCFCRFYYFAFYVIEHYVDPGYKLSGLWSFARYLVSRKREGGK